MKKWFKKTIISLSVIGACTLVPLAVVSCGSNNNSNNNNPNNSSNNNPNNTNNNSQTYVPYSKLTTIVTKEASFSDALANWTKTWNSLINTNQKYLALVTNDVNACLNYYSNLQTNFVAIQPNKNIIETYTQTYSDLEISLPINKFDISYNLTETFSYKINSTEFSNVYSITFHINYQDVSFLPYLFKLTNNQSGNYYGGEYMNKFTYSQNVSLSPLSAQGLTNNIIENSYNQAKTGIPNSSMSNVSSTMSKSELNYFGVYLQPSQQYSGKFICSVNNGINYGNFSNNNQQPNTTHTPIISSNSSSSASSSSSSSTSNTNNK